MEIRNGLELVDLSRKIKNFSHKNKTNYKQIKNKNKMAKKTLVFHSIGRDKFLDPFESYYNIDGKIPFFECDETKKKFFGVLLERNKFPVKSERFISSMTELYQLIDECKMRNIELEIDIPREIDKVFCISDFYKNGYHKTKSIARKTIVVRNNPNPFK